MGIAVEVLLRLMSAVAVFLAIFVVTFLAIYWPINRKLKSLFENRTSPSADVRCQCMIREVFFEQPGVAQVLNGELYLWGLVGDVTRVPLDQVKLTKVYWNRFCLGRWGWWRKTMLYLDTPKTTRLVIGVDNPKPWEGIFQAPTQNR